MRIGEAATAAGVNIQTLRYYEVRGLLPEPRRRAGGYRDYEPDDVRRVRFIKRAQEVGFSLDEIRDLLELRSRERGAGAAREIAAAKIRDIDERLRRLAAMRDALNQLVNACCSASGERHCPIIEALEDDVLTSHVGVSISARRNGATA